MDFLERIIPKIGERIGRYEIVSELGRGGFGVVYRARQVGLEADVAIKVMIPPVTGQSQQMQLYERFSQEAQVIKRLDHPAAIKVRDFGRTGEGLPYLVTEFVPGRTLDRVLAEDGPLPLPRAVRIAKQVLGCLAEAHHHGIVHRDLKPANIMVRDIFGENDSVKVLDFGIAKVLGGDGGVRTETGLRFGTPQYMAPEQALGRKDLDGRLDLYCFGLILAECVSGHLVVDAEEAMSALLRHAGPEEHVFQPAVVSSPLYPIIAVATRKDPNLRFADALAMRRELEQLELRMSFPGMPAVPVGPSAPSSWPPQSTPVSSPVAWGGAPQTPLPTPSGPSPGRPSSAPVGQPAPSGPQPQPQAGVRPGPSRRLWVAAVLALVVVAVGVFLLVGPVSNDDPDGNTNAILRPTGEGGAVDTPPSGTANGSGRAEIAEAPETPQAAAGYSREVQLGRAYLAEARWDDALAVFESVPDGAVAYLATDIALARAEQRHEATWNRVVGAEQAGRYREAWDALSEIPADSFYRERGEREDIPRRLQSAWIDQAVAASQDAVTSGDLDAAWAELQAVLGEFPQDPRVSAQIGAVQQAQAQARERENAEEAEEDEREAEEDPELTTLSPEERPSRASELIRQARRDGLAGRHSEAVALLRQAQELDDSDSTSYLMLYTNYSRLGNNAQAARALREYVRRRPDDYNADSYRQIIEDLEGN